MPSLFLSCSADWTVRLWSEDQVSSSAEIVCLSRYGCSILIDRHFLLESVLVYGLQTDHFSSRVAYVQRYLSIL